MRQSTRTALARSVNDLTDALNPDKDYGLEDAAPEVRERLSLLLERMDDDVHRVKHHGAGARVKVKMDRGDSLRDQDSWTIEGEGETHEEAAREFDALLTTYQERWADDVRDTDPYGDGE